MITHKLAEGKSGGNSYLIFSLLSCVLAIYWASKNYENRQWLSVTFALAYSAQFLYHLYKWWSFKQGHWFLQFEDDELTIFNKDESLFKGGSSELHYIDRTGDGYILSMTPKKKFFLSHKHSDDELSAALDRGINFKTY